MSPLVWFVIAALAAVAGAVLLIVENRRRTAHQRERCRWAALRGWRCVPSDPVIADQWRHGLIARGGPGMATDLVIGSLFTPAGRRSVRVFDHEQSGQDTQVIVALQRRFHAGDLVAELWLDRPSPQDPGLDMLGPVGDRFAFVTDPDRARPLITPELAVAGNALGADVPVVWLEQDWVLAAAPFTATPTRLERLLRTLDEIADLLDAADAADAADADLTDLADSVEPADLSGPGQ